MYFERLICAVDSSFDSYYKSAEHCCILTDGVTFLSFVSSSDNVFSINEAEILGIKKAYMLFGSIPIYINDNKSAILHFVEKKKLNIDLCWMGRMYPLIYFADLLLRLMISQYGKLQKRRTTSYVMTDHPFLKSYNEEVYNFNYFKSHMILKIMTQGENIIQCSCFAIKGFKIIKRITISFVKSCLSNLISILNFVSMMVKKEYLFAIIVVNGETLKSSITIKSSKCSSLEELQNMVNHVCQ